MEDFLQHNRDYRGSPQLVFEGQRRQRVVDMDQALVTSLVQSFEQAKIEEVRSVPLITVIDGPVVPQRPDSRHLLLRGVSGLFLGGLAAVFITLMLETFRLASVGRSSWRDVTRWLRRPAHR